MPAPAAPTAAERRSHALALIAAAILHALFPLGLLAYYALSPVPAPPTQEIPVEVVVEPPPPNPEEPKDKPKPPPEPEVEKPAYDAPRAATPENVNRDSPNARNEGPAAKAEPTPNPGAPEKERPSNPAPAEERQANSASPPLDLNPKPDGDDLAAANPARTDAEAAPASNPAAEPQIKTPVGTPLPTFETLPDYKFARAGRETPIATGNADSRYFTIVYGMIRSHFREPSGPHATLPSRRGAIVFGVDEGGNLIGRKLIDSSGSPSLDMAYMAAIAEAAPYPAPPNWQQRSMRLTYGR